jgi:hypothetical protein
MPVVTLGLHLFMALIYDLDSPDQSRNRYLVMLEAILWNIGLQGCVQPLAALFVAFVVCPVISLTVLTGKLQFLFVTYRAESCLRLSAGVSCSESYRFTV